MGMIWVVIYAFLFLASIYLDSLLELFNVR